MARARNIKPGFFKNEDLAECSPWARLCFAGLWTIADREGRLEDRPRRIKGDLFAFDSIEVEPLLDELATHGFVHRYLVDGKAFIQIVSFKKHQNPHHKEQQSVIPAPEFPRQCSDGTTAKPGALTTANEAKAQGNYEACTGFDGDECAKQGTETVLIPFSLIPDSSLLRNEPPQGGSESRVSKAMRGERLPKEWVLPRKWGDWALAKYPHWTSEIVLDIATTFRNHWSAKTGKDATKLDWEMTWQNWCMSAITQKQYPAPRAAAAEPMSFAERATEAKAQRIAELTGGMANAPLRTTKRETINVDATEIQPRRLA